jgi:hypothetical protein
MGIHLAPACVITLNRAIPVAPTPGMLHVHRSAQQPNGRVQEFHRFLCYPFYATTKFGEQQKKNGRK